MKTIFEGFVNGQQFDNVTEYNRALTQAIQEGKAVQASSRTYTAEQEAEKNIEGKSKSSKELPNFYIGMNKDNYYMDLMTGDKETDEYTLDQCYAVLDKTFDEVVKVVDEMDEEQLKYYKTRIEDILAQLENDKENTNKAVSNLESRIEILKKELEDNEKKLNLCLSCEVINKEMIDYYQDLASEVDYAMGLSEQQQTTCESCCSEPTTSVQEIQPQMEFNADTITGVKRVLGAIFGEDIFNK